MNCILKEIGQRICDRRKTLNYTQEQLAEMMDVSIQMISNLERGNKAIRIENLLKISSILQVSTDYILTGHRTNIEEDALSSKIKQLSEKDYRMILMIVDHCINN